MTEIIAFLLGIFFKAIIAWLVGKYAGGFITWLVAELREVPRIAHYLLSHGGKYYNCIDCKLGHVTNVDSIS